MEEYKTILETTNMGVIVLEEDSVISMVNPQFETLTGYEKAEVEGTCRWTEFVARDELRKILDYCHQRFTDPERAPTSCETVFLTKEGARKNVLLTVATVPGTEKNVVSFLDITSWKTAEQKLTHMATRDVLTGLPNRALFADRLDVALARARRRQEPFAVMLLDLDNFKEINDDFGHKVGDELLRVLGLRLAGILRESDTVARMGGDEFLFLFPEITGPQSTEVVARKILELVSNPYSIRNRRLNITGSIGISIYPNDGQDPDTLLKNADMAMYRAKEQGGNNYQRYTLSMDLTPPRIKVLLLEHDLGYAQEIERMLTDVKRPRLEVILASDLSSGLEHIESGDIDFIIVDLSLPDISDPDNLTKIAVQAPEVPLIVLAQRLEEDLAMKTVQVLAQDYLIKEELSDALLERSIRYAIERNQIQTELRRETALRLQSSGTWSHAVVRGMREGVIVLDEQGIVLLVNPAAEIILRQRADELLGKAFRHPVGTDHITECEILRDNGEKSTVEVRTVQAEWENKMVYIAFVNDITTQKQMHRPSEDTFDTARKLRDDIIQTMAVTISGKDLHAKSHPRRVTTLACAIAKELGLPDEDVDGLQLAATLHDIGKVYVPVEILSKPAGLTDAESQMVKTHPQIGYHLLRNLKAPWPLAEIVHQHHERCDGSGYPQGLADSDIALEAKILAVADVVEAMTSDRPHRPAHNLEETLAEISNKKGILYDSEVVEACTKLFTEKGFSFEQNGDSAAITLNPSDSYRK